jgi:hypothetical protein
LIEGHYITIKNKLFGRSSEKEPSPKDKKIHENTNNKKTRVQLLSLRYPNAPLIEREVEFQEMPLCKCLNHEMSDSGVAENSEFITVVPAEHIVIR